MQWKTDRFLNKIGGINLTWRWSVSGKNERRGRLPVCDIRINWYSQLLLGHGVRPGIHVVHEVVRGDGVQVFEGFTF